ncbi:HNH endonuclease [Wenxinia saemankumensis]|uniref:HNH endonuclease n=1 Tax=Wenxinia saemankumensis TaxID=1447782 RepID=A0A1M6I347_9RHOB|nr:HNH endonuclease [Wenxinia saemankumensis]SHJ28876.1 HNH endonuclease [Wenxinia saemankumensis]
MSLIETYDNLLRNCEELEEARKNRGQVKELYAGLIGRGSVFLPYLTGDGIAFAPSRFIGYTENTLIRHEQSAERDGKKTNARVREILRKHFGFTIWNGKDDVAEWHYHGFCARLGTVPRNSKKTFWITPEMGDWLEKNDIARIDAHEIAALEQEVLADTSIPEVTRKAIVKARIGQGLYRRRVLQKYGCCLITEIKEPALLVASHIKPWRDCRKDPRECLDPENALLLSPTWDRLFDKGFISFTDQGEMIISDGLKRKARKALGVRKQKIPLTRDQAAYMVWHRKIHDFK